MSAPAPVPMTLIFKARAEARKLLFDANEFDLDEALSPLLNLAIECDLASLIGERMVYDLLNDIFELRGEMAL